MDRIVFGPLVVRPRWTVQSTDPPRRCFECKDDVLPGQPYGWAGDVLVCNACADDLEAGRRD
ncbi:hypothetical protein [Streptomyces chartreusis]